jgi:hypothetical protein
MDYRERLESHFREEVRADRRRWFKWGYWSGFYIGVVVAGVLAFVALALLPQCSHAADIPIVDARDATGCTVLAVCGSPMRRVMANGAAVMVCDPPVTVFSDSFETCD